MDTVLILVFFVLLFLIDWNMKRSRKLKESSDKDMLDDLIGTHEDAENTSVNIIDSIERVRNEETERSATEERRGQAEERRQQTEEENLINEKLAPIKTALQEVKQEYATDQDIQITIAERFLKIDMGQSIILKIEYLPRRQIYFMDFKGPGVVARDFSYSELRDNMDEPEDIINLFTKIFGRYLARRDSQ